jgi:hypothetical protein
MRSIAYEFKRQFACDVMYDIASMTWRAHFKKMGRAEGGSKIVGVFRVKNDDFTPKFFFFLILGGGRWVPPLPLDPPLVFKSHLQGICGYYRILWFVDHFRMRSIAYEFKRQFACDVMYDIASMT